MAVKDSGPEFHGDANATLAPDGAVSREQYNLNHGRQPNAPTSGGPRETSKSATYPWTADTAVKASSVKSRGSDSVYGS